jgi:hypothetical protein
MNKRSLQIVLLLGVLSVWGAVLYRIIGHPDSDDRSTVEMVYAMSPGKIVQAFSDSLSLDYPDPFLKGVKAPARHTATVVTISHPPSQKKDIKIEVIPVVIKWPDVIYRGVIQNKLRGSTLAVLSIGGVETLAKAGEHVTGMTILSFTPDEVTIQGPDNAQKVFYRTK